ncbi:MAG TPA: cytochrome c oxidase subunit 3 [Candidatus Acidoferrum sp.]
MAGTPVLDDIELIIEDIGGSGGGKPPERRDDGDGGGDGGNSGRERQPEPRRFRQRKYSVAIALGMLSILVIFMVLTTTFVVLRVENLHRWAGIHLPWILWVNTTILLASSATLEFARRKLRVESLRGFRQMWGLTTALGMIFVTGQAIAWRQLSAEGAFTVSRLASSFFYVFTAVHAVHLLGGICALLYVGLRKFESTRTSRFVAAEVASYYWHFMDGLWLFLFALLYFAR